MTNDQTEHTADPSAEEVDLADLAREWGDDLDAAHESRDDSAGLREWVANGLLLVGVSPSDANVDRVVRLIVRLGVRPAGPRIKTVSASELSSKSLRASDYINKPTPADELREQYQRVIADINNALTPISCFLDDLEERNEELFVDIDDVAALEDARASMRRLRELTLSLKEVNHGS